MGINKLRKKLLDSIKKYNEHSECKVVMEEEIAKQYENSSMYYFYKRSMKNLKLYIDNHNHEMPTISEWNKIAKENGYLSTESMKYMGHIEFPKG